MTILIVEDEKSISESLAELLEALGHTVTAIAETAEEALLALEEELPEVALLDIQLRGKMNGIQLAHAMRERYAVPFVFTTAFTDDDTIAKARDEGPFGYLVKPYSMHDVKAALQIARSNFEAMQKLDQQAEALTEPQAGFFFVKTEGKLVKIELQDLRYVEARGDYMYFATTGGYHLVLTTLKAVEQKLPERDFIRVHRSFIVRLQAVDDLDDSSLVIGKDVIPVSRSYRTALLKRLNVL